MRCNKCGYQGLKSDMLYVGKFQIACVECYDESIMIKINGKISELRKNANKEDSLKGFSDNEKALIREEINK